jgi:hypothetical protein
VDGEQELGLRPFRRYEFLSASDTLDRLAYGISHWCWAPEMQGDGDEAILAQICQLLEDSGRSVVDWA